MYDDSKFEIPSLKYSRNRKHFVQTEFDCIYQEMKFYWSIFKVNIETEQMKTLKRGTNNSIHW